MGSFHIFHFLSLLLLSSAGAGFCVSDSCEPLHCPNGGPVIQFPFRIKERHPPRCGYSGFDISCQDRNTLIRIPSMNRDLVVDDIDYTEQVIKLLLKPKDCIWLPFLNNLNLSVSPFLFDRSSHLTFISCSKNVEFGMAYAHALSCLSDVEQDVFALDADAPVGSMPVSCQPIKTVLMPDVSRRVYFNRPQYDHEEPVYYVSLRWDVPSCKECRWRGMECGFKNESSNDIICFHPPRHDKGLKEKYGIIGASVGTLLLLITVVTSIKVYHSRKLNRKLDVENEIKGKSVVSMTAARGTMGYIAPEVYSRNFGNVSSKSDVYSFVAGNGWRKEKH
ncbi:hypothetical protein MRB53_016274 [Persea americana]|uniref:Uncharacterized protein n=1 Tax=Persea americana TaxID=3435 RepID=A0ACC2M1N9_PERAE|nr:hypothetical protein MRB53_016274 [Persea americana]